jgi:UDP-N-acetylglucosamine 2-epimerase (non-hydrolysing)/GDP/UDP-N,N'-diacetylbacillosamine 2-epimerase (hydrolysing)
MAKTIGVAALGLADCLGQMRPDLLLLIADRFEMLAPAAVATALRIPIAHVEGGEITEGAIDDAIRNALTKLSHLHFTSTAQARMRVIGMGEEEWRVTCAGAPSLDHLRRSTLLDRAAVEARLGIRLTAPIAIVGFHPATMARDTTREADALFEALETAPVQLVFCYPNADAGSRSLVEAVHSFIARTGKGDLFVNLDSITYWSLLRCADLLIGNSSSGIMEAASFAVPAVNIGIRQRGRERDRNVLDATPNTENILDRIAAALDPSFRRSLAGMRNPYGDGHAAGRIVQVLASAPLGEELLIKRSL